MCFKGSGLQENGPTPSCTVDEQCVPINCYLRPCQQEVRQVLLDSAAGDEHPASPAHKQGLGVQYEQDLRMYSELRRASNKKNSLTSWYCSAQTKSQGPHASDCCCFPPHFPCLPCLSPAAQGCSCAGPVHAQGAQVDSKSGSLEQRSQTSVHANLTIVYSKYLEFGHESRTSRARLSVVLGSSHW